MYKFDRKTHTQLTHFCFLVSESTFAFVPSCVSPRCYFHRFGHNNILLTCTTAHIAETATPLITVLERLPLVQAAQALTLSFRQQHKISRAVIVSLCVCNVVFYITFFIVLARLCFPFLTVCSGHKNLLKVQCVIIYTLPSCLLPGFLFCSLDLA